MATHGLTCGISIRVLRRRDLHVARALFGEFTPIALDLAKGFVMGMQDRRRLPRRRSCCRTDNRGQQRGQQRDQMSFPPFRRCNIGFPPSSQYPSIGFGLLRFVTRFDIRP